MTRLEQIKERAEKATKEDVWSEVGGRGPGFTEYMATLIEELAPKRHLDVGCGEGGLLNAVSASLQFGADEFCQDCSLTIQLILVCMPLLSYF